MTKFKIQLTTNPKNKPTDENALGFGQIFTDHMFVADYDKNIGWHDGRIVPFAPISLTPAAAVFHYGSEVFEGLKAYRTAEGNVQLFRPIENVKRINVSGERVGLPKLDEQFALDAIEKLIEIEQDWVPHSNGTSLYIRPFIFACDESLGVHGIEKAKFVIITSPVGSYYKEGLNPVSIMVETEDVRAVKGGTGYTKCGGNYAAAVRAGEKAAEKGYSQVLWLDGVHRKYIEEVGAMNVMFKINGEILTPMLSGSILSGITRKSIIEFMASEGVTVNERLISVDELVEALENGTLEEAWGCGTAAVVSPIGKFSINGKEYTVNGGKIGKTTQMIYDRLTDIQWGRAEDKFGWIVPIKK